MLAALSVIVAAGALAGAAPKGVVIEQTTVHAVRSMVGVVHRLCADAKVKLEDLKLLIPHQANLRIIEAVGKSLGLPSEKVFVNIQKYANTSSATTIIALDEARRAGLVKAGDLVILVAFGAGLTWGGVLIRW